MHAVVLRYMFAVRDPGPTNEAASSEGQVASTYTAHGLVYGVALSRGVVYVWFGLHFGQSCERLACL